MITSAQIGEPADVLYRIKRGLSGYVSYLAACEMNQSFSEYVLYEPILRILPARGFVVDSEKECPGISHAEKGDRKRLDFVASGNGVRFALEVKWARQRTIDVANDHSKLQAFLTDDEAPPPRAFLCVFGRKSHIADLKLRPGGFRERGSTVVADFGRTRFRCRVFELQPSERSRKEPRRRRTRS